ncbi:MAG: hypothetical protein U0T78_09410 [Cloacibacterium normanense]
MKNSRNQNKISLFEEMILDEKVIFYKKFQEKFGTDQFMDVYVLCSI